MAEPEVIEDVKPFTQAELDTILCKRLAAEQAKFPTGEELTAFEITSFPTARRNCSWFGKGLDFIFRRWRKINVSPSVCTGGYGSPPDCHHRVKKAFFDTMTGSQESPKDKETLTVGVHGYGRSKFPQ